MVYSHFNGRLVHEDRGGVERGYVPDPLGSTVALVDESGAVQNTYRYKPYGGLQVKTGNAADPSFLWIGSAGYRERAANLEYVRARHYHVALGKWGSIDIDSRSTNLYDYATVNPTTYVDPSGNDPDPCKGGGTNPNDPPDCSQCPPKGRCKATWLTCYEPKPGKTTAVYCNPDDMCTDTWFVFDVYIFGCKVEVRDISGIWQLERGYISAEDRWIEPSRGWERGRPVGKGYGRKITVQVPCGEMCIEYHKMLGKPVFPRGSCVDVKGFGQRTINDCGCGQEMQNKPNPDNWLDIGNGCPSGWKNQWACVCPC